LGSLAWASNAGGGAGDCALDDMVTRLAAMAAVTDKRIIARIEGSIDELA
jgi:hypothetical protein